MVRKDIIDNRIYLNYFMLLGVKKLNISQIASKLNKSYSIVHRQISYLYREKYLNFDREGYWVDKNKFNSEINKKIKQLKEEIQQLNNKINHYSDLFLK